MRSPPGRPISNVIQTDAAINSEVRLALLRSLSPSFPLLLVYVEGRNREIERVIEAVCC